MKKLNLLLFLLVSFLFSKGQSYELVASNKVMAPMRDTINLTDVNAKKQGEWTVRGKNKPGSGYKPDQKIEEGIYKDNRKIGIWSEFYKNGNIKNKITFVDGKPHGPTTMYYENGKVKEEGIWINNRWTGNYKFYDEAGTLTEKVFDDKGKELSSKITPSKNSVPSKKK